MHVAFLVSVVPDAFVLSRVPVRAESRSVPVRTGPPTMEGSLMGFHERELEAVVQGGGNPTYRVRSAAERRQMRDATRDSSGAMHAATSESFVHGGLNTAYAVRSAAERRQPSDPWQQQQQQQLSNLWETTLALLEQGKEEDERGNSAAAYLQYSEAIWGLQALLEQEADARRQELLHARLVEYSARLQQLDAVRQEAQKTAALASPSAPVQSPPVARQLSPGSRAPPSPLPESSVHEGGHDPWTMHAGEQRYSRGHGFPTDRSPRTTPLQVRYGAPSAEAILEYGDGSSCE